MQLCYRARFDTSGSASICRGLHVCVPCCARDMPRDYAYRADVRDFERVGILSVEPNPNLAKPEVVLAERNPRTWSSPTCIWRTRTNGDGTELELTKPGLVWADSALLFLVCPPPPATPETTPAEQSLLPRTPGRRQCRGNRHNALGRRESNTDRRGMSFWKRHATDAVPRQTAYRRNASARRRSGSTAPPATACRALRPEIVFVEGTDHLLKSMGPNMSMRKA